VCGVRVHGLFDGTSPFFFRDVKEIIFQVLKDISFWLLRNPLLA
jgi:hypothetical protein